MTLKNKHFVYFLVNVEVSVTENKLILEIVASF